MGFNNSSSVHDSKCTRTDGFVLMVSITAGVNLNGDKKNLVRVSKTHHKVVDANWPLVATSD